MSKKNIKCPVCERHSCICMSWCPGAQLGCCNQENSSKNCAGPVHLTAQFDIGSRSCCVGEKYSAMGGILNYCSTNGGKEFPNGIKTSAHFTIKNNEDKGIPNPADPATWLKPVLIKKLTPTIKKCVPQKPHQVPQKPSQPEVHARTGVF